MSDDSATIGLDLDPKKVMAAIAEMNAEFKGLSANIELALGKNAVKSIAGLEDAAEKGTGRISEYFRNLGQRVREDLRTAFDATGVLAGAKFGKDLGSGVAQVFELERAFDRLNTRLKMSNSEMNTFKTNLGRRVAETGQRMEDVLPGVETASAKGGVRDSGQLVEIGEALGKVRAATGENTDQLSETVVQLLKDQGRKVTAESYKSTLDALQGTRVSGNFHSANDAGMAIQELSHNLTPDQQKRLGLDTRTMGGLAAAASTAGAGGQESLANLLKQAATPGGTTKLNEIFGTQLFGKNGKIDASKFGSIDKGRFGQYSEQTLGAATGMDQAELSRFIDAMKNGMGQFNSVVSGSAETASQFEGVSHSLAAGVDRFKERVKEAGREIGEELSQAGRDLLNGNVSGAANHAVGALKAASENRGTVAAAGLLTLGAGLLAGGSANRLLSRVGGGGTAVNALKGQAYKAAGVEPVYVVNAGEIGAAAKDEMSGLKGLNPGKMDVAKGWAGMAGKGLAAAGAAAAAWEIGQAIGEALLSIPGVNKMMESAGDMAYNALNNDKNKMGWAEDAQNAKGRASFNERNGTQLTAAEYSKAVEEGTLRAHSKAGQKVQYTNPSKVVGRGG